MRRAGLKPALPGKHKAADRLKARAFTAALAVKRKLKPGDGVVPVESKDQKKRIAALVAAR